MQNASMGAKSKKVRGNFAVWAKILICIVQKMSLVIPEKNIGEKFCAFTGPI